MVLKLYPGVNGGVGFSKQCKDLSKLNVILIFQIRPSPF